MKSGSTHPSIDRIAELQQLVASFAQIKRTNKLVDNEGLENDVEHSYGLALTCWFLYPHVAPELNLAKIIQYALVHDLAEIYAGDFYFLLSPDEQKKKKIEESKAVSRLQHEWKNDFPGLTDTLIDYEEKRDEESWFVYAVDKILPPIMINMHEKEAYYERWKLDKEALFQKKRETIGKSKHVAIYIDRYLEWLDDPDYFYKKKS
jgi:5'-deoxynucleotidase YfbR-like HD superfamily hydrolase